MPCLDPGLAIGTHLLTHFLDRLTEQMRQQIRTGFASGDEWIAVQPVGKGTDGPWRLQSLDDVTLYAGNAKAVTAIVSRDKRLLPLTLTLPKPSHAVRLAVRDKALANAWLGQSPESP